MKMRRLAALVLTLCMLLNVIPCGMVNAVADDHVHQACKCAPPRIYYEQKDMKSHVKVYNNGDELCSCGKVMVPGEETRTTENHIFDSHYVCTLCGYGKQIHEHSASKCGKSSTNYQKKDATYHVKVYYEGDNLCSCGAFISEGKTTKTDEKHSFDSNDKCTKCGYKKGHVHQACACGRSSTSYEQQDATSHVRVDYEGDNLCSCGAFVSKGNSTKTTESHTFDSDGRCTVCGYKPEHIHQACACGKPSTTYKYIDEYAHWLIEYEGDYLCSCGEFVCKGNESWRQARHTFDDNDCCTGCGYKREHVHEPRACGPSSTTYEKQDESYHAKYYYDGDRLCSCGQFICEGKTTASAEYHTFNNDGYCTLCGYQKVHVHEACKCGPPKTTYEQQDSSSHVKVVYEGDQLCSCGEYMYDGATTKTSEAHSFDGRGYCSLCGYHEHKACACGLSSTSYEQKDSSSHVKVVYEGDQLCSCGAYVCDGATTRTTENHTFNSDDCCTGCGYKKIHVHEACKCGPSKTTYEKKDDSYHVKVVYGGDHLCNCGAFVCKGETKRYTDKHTIKDGVCTECGYAPKTECSHEASHYSKETHTEYIDFQYHYKVTVTTSYCDCGRIVDVSESKVKERHLLNCDCSSVMAHTFHPEAPADPDIVSYENITKASHTKITTTANVYCSVGNELLKLGETTKVVEDHTFKNGVCTSCGYKKGEHAHHSSTGEKKAISYGYSNRTSHMVCVLTNDVYCDECGELMHEGTIECFLEDHQYDDNNICKYCGAERIVQDRITFDELWHQVVLGEFSDDVTVDGTSYEIMLSFVPIVDQIMDGRDLIASIEKNESFFDVAINAIGFVPIIGTVFKYSDEIADIAKHGDDVVGVIKYGDEVVGTVKYGDEIAELLSHADEAGYVLKHQDEGFALLKKSDDVGAVFKQAGKMDSNADEVADVVKNGSGVSVIYRNGAVYTSGVKLDDASQIFQRGEQLADGSIRYSDEALEAIRYGEKLTDISDARISEFEEMIDAVCAQNPAKYVKPDSHIVVTRASTVSDSFSSYNSFKRSYGRAGDSLEWHHIVEQKGSGFEANLVQSADNIVAIDTETHRMVTAFYNTTYQGTGMKVRDFIKSQGWSFEEEYQFGIQVLERMGVIVR